MNTSKNRALKRRTLQQLRVPQPAEYHHSVYVVLLQPAAKRLRLVRAANPGRDPAKPCVYVGMTGLTPEARFVNHQRSIKAAAVVTRYGGATDAGTLYASKPDAVRGGGADGTGFGR